MDGWMDGERENFHEASLNTFSADLPWKYLYASFTNPVSISVMCVEAESVWKSTVRLSNNPQNRMASTQFDVKLVELSALLLQRLRFTVHWHG